MSYTKARQLMIASGVKRKDISRLFWSIPRPPLHPTQHKRMYKYDDIIKLIENYNTK